NSPTAHHRRNGRDREEDISQIDRSHRPIPRASLVDQRRSHSAASGFAESFHECTGRYGPWRLAGFGSTKSGGGRQLCCNDARRKGWVVCDSTCERHRRRDAACAAEKIFEPFFTTKDPGQGTRLGAFDSVGNV